MKIFAHNFNPDSNSGPNKFTRQLFNQLKKEHGVSNTANQQEADVEFCLIQQVAHKVKPMVLRLDGIYFNSDQHFTKQNAPIRFSYENADAVIFQSEFNKKLTKSWFGDHPKSYVVHNAADPLLITAANSHFWDRKFGADTEVWSCASNWRPHKRLKDNVRFFLEFAPKNSILAIAGALGMDEAKEFMSIDKRIHVLGDLDYMSLLSLYKRSKKFIHLAYLDHCPNVVVDAQSAGCEIICSSTGGTHEIVNNGIIVNESEWDLKPCKLYSPPEINFYNTITINKESNNSFEKCVATYYNIFKEVINEK